MGVKIGKGNGGGKESKSKGKAKSPGKMKATAVTRVEPEKLAAGEDNPTPGLTAVETDAVEFRGEGDTFFHVVKGAHAAIVKGDSKGDARAAFMDLYGIVSTEEKIQIGEIDEDDLDALRLTNHGVILGPQARGRIRHAHRGGVNITPDDSRDDE